MMMKKELSFEYILKVDNNWLLFKELYKDELSDDVIREAEKMLKCRTPECGFATYICTNCGNERRIPFSCKSKLCSRCGKKYTDAWAQVLSKKLLNTDHRHIVLTISHRLWSLFINNPSLQKLLLDTAALIIRKVFSRKEKVAIGLVLVLHPFGDDLKANFHVHAVATAGGLSKDNNQWIKVPYIDYGFIRKTWQYEVLTALRKHLPARKIFLNTIIDWCFRYNTNGFIIFADRIIKGSKRFILSYVARYTRHPAISKRRILSYDGTYVTFSYEAYGKELTKKMPKFEFIKAVLQHVASKHFKTVRRFGLYSRRSSAKYERAKSLLPLPHKENLPEFNWRKNLIAFTGKDPLRCNKCGYEMDLFKVTYPDKFGFLKTIGGYDWICDDFSPKSLDSVQEKKESYYQVHLSEMSC